MGFVLNNYFQQALLCLSSTFEYIMCYPQYAIFWRRDCSSSKNVYTKLTELEQFEN
ncbi:hypothetical protein ACU8KH_01672 [Lachancea thermotolerans]